jgi:RHS repeat-associated protein
MSQTETAAPSGLIQAGASVRQYVWSPLYTDALILRARDADGDGSLEERRYVAQDANYECDGDARGRRGGQERYVYDPYGAQTIYDPTYSVVRSASSWGWVFGFRGLRLDTATGKYHARNRDYDPAQGRWTTVDPIGFDAGDINLYRLEGNSPLQNLDPSGNQWVFGLKDTIWVRLSPFAERKVTVQPPLDRE